MTIFSRTCTHFPLAKGKKTKRYRKKKCEPFIDFEWGDKRLTISFVNDIYFELIPLVNFAIAGTHILILYIFAYFFFLFLSQPHSLFFFVCIRVRFVSCESTAIGKMQLATRLSDSFCDAAHGGSGADFRE